MQATMCHQSEHTTIAEDVDPCAVTQWLQFLEGSGWKEVTVAVKVQWRSKNTVLCGVLSLVASVLMCGVGRSQC